MRIVKEKFKAGTLIHDGAPAKILRRGKKPILRRLDDEEFRNALCEKIQDELSTYMKNKNNGEKLADVLEALYFLAEEFHGYTRSDLDYYIVGRTFDDRLFLESIEEQDNKKI